MGLNGECLIWVELFIEFNLHYLKLSMRRKNDAKYSVEINH